MIVIDFPEPADGLLQIRVNGHAGKSDKGEDVVCAAVSALVQTLAGGIQDGLGASVTGKLESGDSELMIKVEPQNHEALRLISKVFRFGFHKICESYPEHVKMI